MTADISLAHELSFACELADAAWSQIRPHFRALKAVEGKAEDAEGFDPVTEADRAAEQAIRTRIKATRPHHGMLGEEFGAFASTSGWTWTIDPIDGTRAFVAGLPVWTTLIALCDPDGQPVIGVIDQPVLGERYLGWPGGAALESNGHRSTLQVSACDDLRLATIATTDPFIFTPPERGAWDHVRAAARITRYGLDAYAYARLAAGTIDLVAESGLKSWDVAALIPVIRGAGGLVTDWRGDPPKLGGQIVAASSAGVLDQALLALKRSAL